MSSTQVGRLHVFLGAAVTNCLRRAARDKARGAARTITLKQSFCIWFSGLRGGVAFAIAAASYGDLDFPTRCGGWKPASQHGQLPPRQQQGLATFSSKRPPLALVHSDHLGSSTGLVDGRPRRAVQLWSPS